MRGSSSEGIEMTQCGERVKVGGVLTRPTGVSRKHSRGIAVVAATHGSQGGEKYC